MAKYWDTLSEEKRAEYREKAKIGMARIRSKRPPLRWSHDTMTYAIARAAARGAGIPMTTLYFAKKNRGSPDLRICEALVEYSEGLLQIDDFRTTLDDELLEWEAVRREPRRRKA